MKTPKQLLLSLAMAVMSLTLINCGGSSGGSSNNSSPAVAATNYGASCGNNMIQSQYGCLPRCGVNSVIYQNQCVPVAANQYGYNNGYGVGNVQMCQGQCPAGLVSSNGGSICMPQGTCGACYAQVGSQCYIGDYAYQYYGYQQSGYGGYGQGYGYGYPGYY